MLVRAICTDGLGLMADGHTVNMPVVISPLAHRVVVISLSDPNHHNAGDHDGQAHNEETNHATDGATASGNRARLIATLTTTLTHAEMTSHD